MGVEWIGDCKVNRGRQERILKERDVVVVQNTGIILITLFTNTHVDEYSTL